MLSRYISILGLFVILPMAAQANGPEFVEQRQRAFEEIEDGTDGLPRLARQKRWDELAEVAAYLETTTRELLVQFPGHTEGMGKSKPRVWRDWTGFSARLEDLADAYGEIDEVAREERQLAQGALERAEKSCRSCHRRYKKRW
ncbi:MAG: cytochrome c [Pseudohaliea sp.]